MIKNACKRDSGNPWLIDNISTDATGINPITIPIDIKPGSYPSPLNVTDKGVLPVAILGIEDFDVFTIDFAIKFVMIEI